MTKSLHDYLSDADSNGTLDHSMRATKGADGQIRFYIHPAGRDGETLDFELVGSQVLPIASAPTVPASK